VILNIRPLLRRPRTYEGAGFEVIGTTKAVFEQQPTCSNQALADQAQLAVQGDRLLACILNVDFQMVLQIFSNARKFMHYLYTSFAQNLRRANSGQLQNAW